MLATAWDITSTIQKGDIDMPRKRTDRPIQIHFRVTQNEYTSIKDKADKSGLSLSDFARDSLMNKKIISAPPADFITLIREVKRIGSNLNQLVRKLNTLGIAHSLELDRCEKEIREVEKMLYQTFRPREEED